MTLHVYLARRFLGSFLAVFAVFALLTVVIEFESALRGLRASGINARQALELALLRAPGTLYEIVPLMVLLASIFLALRMSRSSELVITRAVGRSMTVTLAAPAVAALLLGGLMVAVLNPIAVATGVEYDLRQARMSGEGPRELSISAEGLWLREGDAGMHRVLHARRASTDARRLFDVALFEFDATGRPVKRHVAAEASLGDGVWALRDGKSWQLDGDAAPAEARSRRFEQIERQTELTPAQILGVMGVPERVSVWDMRQHIERLERAGLSAVAHRVHLHSQIALPVLLAGMALLGAALLTRPARLGGAGVLALAALLSGFGIFFLRNFAGILGRAGDVPLLLAAWSLPVATILLGLTFLLFREEG